MNVTHGKEKKDTGDHSSQLIVCYYFIIILYVLFHTLVISLNALVLFLLKFVLYKGSELEVTENILLIKMNIEAKRKNLNISL